jgi:hypothetical protein
VRTALFDTETEALADPKERAQEMRCNDGAACLSVEQPPASINQDVKEVMVKGSEKTIDE